MNVIINESWKAYLRSEFEKPYFNSLVNFVRSEYSNYTCYPKGNKIFSAFDHCPLDTIKVVIIGQDP
ncbi:MAG: uracil-DNA glycosylase, partial [Bacteroidota bacterium]